MGKGRKGKDVSIDTIKSESRGGGGSVCVCVCEQRH